MINFVTVMILDMFMESVVEMQLMKKSLLAYLIPSCKVDLMHNHGFSFVLHWSVFILDDFTRPQIVNVL